MKEIILHDGTVLVEGKRYKWSGVSEGLYTKLIWTESRCRIKKIVGDKIYIYDYDDNKQYEYTKYAIRVNMINFKKSHFYGLI